MDVEKEGPQHSRELRLVKAIGRRAFDRRNNLFHDGRNNLVYTLGTNIILQNDDDPTKQQLIAVDPDKYSHCPQISCISFVNGHLIATTEEEFSRAFIWDIYSVTCLNQIILKNFSIVYHLAQSSTHKIFLAYGINSQYEPLFQLIDW